MKYEDLKDSFEFKTMEGKGALTYTAERQSKHVWSISNDDTDMSADWDCEDMLEHFTSGAWVTQDDEETEQVPVAQEQVEQTPEVKTLRDELIIAVLPTVCAAFFSKNYAPDSWTKYIADDTIAIVDSVLKARKEQE